MKNLLGCSTLAQSLAPRLRKCATGMFLLIALTTSVSNQPIRADEETNTSEQTPQGSWLYTVTTFGLGGSPTVFHGLETYSAGGTYVEDDQLAYKPFFRQLPDMERGGVTSKDTLLMTYLNLTHDSGGNPTGRGKVRQTARVVGDSYSGSGDYFYYDLDGHQILAGRFTVTAERVQVETPQL